MEILQSALAELREYHDTTKCSELCEELLQISWETLHHGHWKDVPLIWRDLYSYQIYCARYLDTKICLHIKVLL